MTCDTEIFNLRAIRGPANDDREVNEELVSVLDGLCHEIELPQSRIDDAKGRYNTIGEVLAGDGSDLTQFGPRVYAQGSIGLGTTVKPLKTHEFDVDLALLFSQRPAGDPDSVRHLLFNRLDDHGRYKGKVKLLARCIQLTYADEFHMDIMPCIPAPGNKVQVPDKRAGGWVLSDPEGYATWFAAKAVLSPMRRKKAAALLENRSFSANAKVDPFPEWDGLRKHPLQRCVQLLKRHRDKMFYDDRTTAPSSIIITTLAAHSYARAVQSNDYDSPIHLLEDVISGLLDFLEVRKARGHPVEYRVTNPVLDDENFASKWGDNQILPENFYAWHGSALRSIRQLSKLAGQGLHQLGRVLGEDYGQDSADQAIRNFSNAIQNQREAGKLNIIVSAPGGAPRIQTVPRHTHFGR